MLHLRRLNYYASDRCAVLSCPSADTRAGDLLEPETETEPEPPEPPPGQGSLMCVLKV